MKENKNVRTKRYREEKKKYLVLEDYISDKYTLKELEEKES